MESHNKFDLEAEIGKWWREMARAGLASEVLVELEEHLREDYERQARAGTNPTEAWQGALQRIGRPKALKKEFDLAGSRGVVETLRRHGWKLALCLACGVGAAIALPRVRPGSYQSEAKLLIRSVIQTGSSQTSGQASVTALVPVSEQTRVMNDQAEILRSATLAERVVEQIGAKRILRLENRNDLVRAAAVVKEGLNVRMPENSNVILISFRHPDATLSQPVLREVIEQFLKLHVETHRAADRLPVPIPTVRVSNISSVASPSPPFLDRTGLIGQQALIVTLGLFAGVVWMWMKWLTESRPKLAA